MTVSRKFFWSVAVVATLAFAFANSPAFAQWTAEKPGSDNITVLSHLPLGPRLSVSDTDIEQELDRPYAYVGRMVYGFEGDKGIDIIDLHDPTKPQRASTRGGSRTRIFTSAPAAWTSSTSSGTTVTTSCSRCNSGKAVLTPIWARSCST